HLSRVRPDGDRARDDGLRRTAALAVSELQEDPGLGPGRRRFRAAGRLTSAILTRVSDANATGADGANGAAAPAAPAAPEQTHELLARINLFAGLSPVFLKRIAAIGDIE